MYGVRTAPRSGYFIFKISRSGYPPVRGKSHGLLLLLRSGCPPLQISRISTNGYLPLNMSRSGVDFFECVTEWSGAGIRLRGKSRIVTERISAATNVTDCCGADIRRTFFCTGRFISIRRANRTKSRRFPTVHLSHYP